MEIQEMDPKTETEMQRITEKHIAQRTQCIPTAKGRQRQEETKRQTGRQIKRQKENRILLTDTGWQTEIRK